MSETSEEMFRKYTPHDFSLFKWRVLHHICQMPDSYGGFTETELFLHTNLRAYFDDKLKHEYLEGRRGALYRMLMEHVMTCLEERDAVEISRDYEYGESIMKIYNKTETLKKICSEILSLGLGASDKLDKLLPVNRV
jgi:hypothetical protein